jgi:hypothetical protein
MPFKSEKQRRYLWATHPDIAKRWAHKYPESNKGLPMYADDKKDEKKASLDILTIISPYVSGRKLSENLINAVSRPETAKNANDKLIKVDIPHSDKPTYAGQERDEGEINEEKAAPAQTEHREPENAINSLLQKISAVFSQPILQEIERRKALAEAREPVYTPKNQGIKRYSAPGPVTPPPMGMTAPPQPSPGQTQPAQAPAQQGAGMNSPSANPINSFGPISSTGNINGNAAFGIKNSPDSMKTAGINPILASIMSIDNVGIPDPEDLDYDDEYMKSATQKCSCGCGDTVTTCKCGPDCSCRKPGGSCYKGEKKAGTPAWQRSAGKNPEGGLNAKGRASYKAETGGTLKAPVTESNPSGERAKRQNSFCSRMCGMKRVNTGASTAKDPDSRINKSLRKWNCKCSSAMDFGRAVKLAVNRGLADVPTGVGPEQIQDALFRFNQLRALTRPSDETLRENNLSRKDFQHELRRIARSSQNKDRFELSKIAPNPAARAGLAGLAGLGGVGLAGYLGGHEAAMSTLPLATAAAGGAYLDATIKRRNLLNTSKMLKNYGLLNPKTLRQAYPLIGDDYRIS